jgi:hypothetical protein
VLGNGCEQSVARPVEGKPFGPDRAQGPFELGLRAPFVFAVGLLLARWADVRARSTAS